MKCINRKQFEIIADLKVAIQNKISIIKPTVLESVLTSLDKIIKKEESHFEKYYC